MADFEYMGEVQPPVNVLASRYASPEMVALFSDEGRVYLERGIWIEIMKAQSELGVDISDGPLSAGEVIEDYERVQGVIDLESMREREKISHHDVNSRIEEFNHLAGHQKIHLGMTSRDITENTEQFQILRGLDLISLRIAATLGMFATRAVEYEGLAMAGRSHNVAAQTITLGKRFANYGEELLNGYDRVKNLRNSYALRGLKGPMGTQQDMLALLGNKNKVAHLESGLATKLGFGDVLNSVGQVYPRSLDFDVVTALKQATCGPANFANTLRLMAGQELATEGFEPGQVGSNAMPHKMNAAKSERIGSLGLVLSGHVAMAANLADRQWNEGDVSCSATRRVMMPDAFFTTDGIFQTTMKVLEKFGAYPAVVEKELQRYLPFLVSTVALTHCVQAGMGREDAHAAIKKHATAMALEMREQGATENTLFERLAADENLPIDKATLDAAASSPLELTGLARTQIGEFVDKVTHILDQEQPAAKNYVPATVL